MLFVVVFWGVMSAFEFVCF